MSIDLSTYKKEIVKTEVKPHNLRLKAKFTDKKKEIFYRELGMLLRSGVDFKKSLEILIDMSKKVSTKDIIIKLKNDIIEGKNIWEAMKASGHFSPYEYYSTQIGEETGRLDIVLAELQKFYGRKIQMRRQIISVFTYPAIVLTVTFLVLYFMLTKVVPMFESVFRQFNSELPTSTKYILKLSENSGLAFSMISGCTLLCIVIHYTQRHNCRYRKITSSAMLKIPYFGNLMRIIYLSRFCQSMGLLTASRTPLITSLALTGKMIQFYPVEHSIEEIKNVILKGASLSDSLKMHKVYDDKLVSMVQVAEQVNQLDVMFDRLGEQYNEEISHQTKMIGIVLEPAIIIIIGLIVGIIMISMYAPMFDLSKIINR